MKNLWLALAFFVGSGSIVLGNGGAWQTGVPGTGSASASNQNHKTDVMIEDETLKIDLHPEYAAVDVHYRMHNTGPKVQQDFFFPVERWEKNPDADIEPTQSHIEHYKISVDGKDLKSTNVAGAKQQSSERKEKTGKGNEESSEAKEEDSEAKQEGSDAEGEERVMRRTMNRCRMIRTLATRLLHIRCRLQQHGKGRLAKAKLRSMSFTRSLKTFRSRSQKIGSKKSAIPVTNGTLKT